MDFDIPFDVRVILIEGVAGSGKDTLQKLLTDRYKDKNVVSFSEGELLFSWKHARIEGVAKLRFQFMKLFLDYVGKAIRDDSDIIFILNRFHLSSYMAHVCKDKRLVKVYNEIISRLKELPVHIVLLQLDEQDIEKRSKHSERPQAWTKYQKAMVKKEGFKSRTERYINEQKLMLRAAKNDGVPYTICNLRMWDL